MLASYDFTAARIGPPAWLLAIASAAIATLATLAQPAFAEMWLRYEPEIVEVEGTVIRVEKFGPPGYGEDPDVDEKDVVPHLRLHEPVNVLGDLHSDLNAEAELHVTELALIFPASFDFSRRYGREIVAVGTLTHSVNAHQSSKVLMDVRRVEIRPR